MAASSPASELLSRPCSSASARDAVARADGVGEFVERALLGAEHHGLNVAERDLAPACRVEQKLFKFRGDEHHVGAERVHQLARGVGLQAQAGLLRLG